MIDIRFFIIVVFIIFIRFQCLKVILSKRNECSKMKKKRMMHETRAKNCAKKHLGMNKFK